MRIRKAVTMLLTCTAQICLGGGSEKSPKRARTRKGLKLTVFPLASVHGDSSGTGSSFDIVVMCRVTRWRNRRITNCSDQKREQHVRKRNRQNTSCSIRREDGKTVL